MTERDGQSAVVLAVPVQECIECGETWLTIEVAKHLDGLFDQLLDSGAQTSRIHWDQSHAASQADDSGEAPVRTELLLEAMRGAPAIEPEQFRADVDAPIDQRIAPQG